VNRELEISNSHINDSQPVWRLDLFAETVGHAQDGSYRFQQLTNGERLRRLEDGNISHTCKIAQGRLNVIHKRSLPERIYLRLRNITDDTKIVMANPAWTIGPPGGKRPQRLLGFEGHGTEAALVVARAGGMN